ncbi:hypothetical protein ABBQ38_013137 [Trebouxia sp. C0009 RCD-2024]
MQGLSSSALGAPVETEAASVATEQRNGAPEARRSEGPGERSDATQPGNKGFVDLRQKNLHKTGPETKKLIVQQALNTEDMDQERFLTKIRERLDRYV